MIIRSMFLLMDSHEIYTEYYKHQHVDSDACKFTVNHIRLRERLIKLKLNKISSVYFSHLSFPGLKGLKRRAWLVSNFCV